jgi:hypothetical protein
MVVCNLCGEDVPADDRGIGGTLMVVHAHEHDEERKKLGMPLAAYCAMCRRRRVRL